MNKLIYYLEDDEQIGSVVKLSLETIDDIYPIKVELIDNYKSFIKHLDELKPSLIILDLMLPDKNGYDVLKEIKNSIEFKHIPVIIVSARISEFDRVKCLEAGALHYFTKPFFGLIEFNAAVKNSLKISSDSLLVSGDLVLDINSREVTKSGKPISLTTKEFDLLKLLINSQKSRISKAEIANAVWPGKNIENSRSIDAHIKSIRKKVFPDDPNAIETIVKFGYTFTYAKK